MPNAPTKPRPDVEAIEARWGAAQGGPYYLNSTQDGTAVIARAHSNVDDSDEVLFEADWGTRDTASFLAHARQDIPALITHIEALESAIKATGPFPANRRWTALNEIYERFAALGDGDGAG